MRIRAAAVQPGAGRIRAWLFAALGSMALAAPHDCLALITPQDYRAPLSAAADAA
jgi:hypothetical protein